MASRALAGVVIGSVGALFAGCGDDDKGPKAPTKSAYIQRADAVCRAGNAELNRKANERLNDTSAPEEVKRFGLEVLIPNIEAQLAKLRELPVPEGDEKQIEAVWDAAQKGLDGLKADPEEFVRAGQPESFKTTSRLAAAYGFKVCGSTN
jgi:hypothetical protein